jgi:hypothetical protein
VRGSPEKKCRINGAAMWVPARTAVGSLSRSVLTDQRWLRLAVRWGSAVRDRLCGERATPPRLAIAAHTPAGWPLDYASRDRRRRARSGKGSEAVAAQEPDPVAGRGETRRSGHRANSRCTSRVGTAQHRRHWLGVDVWRAEDQQRAVPRNTSSPPGRSMRGLGDPRRGPPNRRAVLADHQVD